MEEEVKTLRRTGSSIVVYCTGERYIAESDTSLGGNFLPIVFLRFDIGICCRRSLYNLSMCSLGGHFLREQCRCDIGPLLTRETCAGCIINAPTVELQYNDHSGKFVHAMPPPIPNGHVQQDLTNETH